MAQYKNADDLKEHIKSLTGMFSDDLGFAVSLDAVLGAINFAPTADVVEVKHGHWIQLDECANEGVYCSVCHKKVYKIEYANQALKSAYCPNCGTKMDGGAE